MSSTEINYPQNVKDYPLLRLTQERRRAFVEGNTYMKLRTDDATFVLIDASGH